MIEVDLFFYEKGPCFHDMFETILQIAFFQDDKKTRKEQLETLLLPRQSRFQDRNYTSRNDYEKQTNL